MSEFRVVDGNGDPYPPLAQPCRTLRAAMRRRDFYEQVTSVSGEARPFPPVQPLRIERRSKVVSMWEPWNVGAARDTNEPKEPPEGHHRPAPDALRDCYVCGRPQREHAGGAECDTPPPTGRESCHACHGTGADPHRPDRPCDECGGYGFYPQPEPVDTPPPNPSPDEPTRYARRGFGIASGAPPVMSNMRAPEPEGDNPAITPPSNPYPRDGATFAGSPEAIAYDRGFAAGIAAVRSWLRDEIYDPADGNGGAMTVRHLIPVFDVKFGAARDTPDGKR